MRISLWIFLAGAEKFIQFLISGSGKKFRGPDGPLTLLQPNWLTDNKFLTFIMIVFLM